MSWACELTEDAKRDLRELPKIIRKRVARVLDGITLDPFQGDLKALQGAEWKGVFRRRMGDYRLLFTADRETETVYVLRILLRSGKTYR